MKQTDILRQAVTSLLRHKSRSLLTVLGVIVGCCSVVIMISIGVGMRISTQETLAQMGDLTTIQLWVQDESSGAKLDDTAVSRLAALDHVAAVIPKINEYTSCTLQAGPDKRYVFSGVSIIGEEFQGMKAEGLELAEGSWETLKKGDVLVGQYLAYAFEDSKRPAGHNTINRYEYYNWEDNSYSTDLPAPYVDVAEDKLVLTIGEEAGEGGAGKNVTVELQIGGVLKEDWNRGYETSEGIYMDLQTWKDLLDQYAKLTGGKKQSEKGYTSILVKADDISNVESVEREIKRMGFGTSSMESIRKPMEQDVQQKQMLLGGVGAVSLFVAALGIANTMIMAISERIREIGVMKSLGCFLKDIRKMFLLEAGCIGLIGGCAGIGLSYLISYIMNHAGNGALFGNAYDYLLDASSMAVSVIPWWLAAFAVVFSILIGVLAGLYPAEKAVRIPALEAIRHD